MADNEAGHGQGYVPPTKGPPVTNPAALPEWVIFGGGLLLVAAIAEGLYAVKPLAGYGFAALVLLGYAISGNRLEEAIKQAQGLGFLK